MLVDPDELAVLTFRNHPFAEVSAEDAAELHQLALVELVVLEFALDVEHVCDGLHVHSEELDQKLLGFGGQHLVEEGPQVQTPFGLSPFYFCPDIPIIRRHYFPGDDVLVRIRFPVAEEKPVFVACQALHVLNFLDNHHHHVVCQCHMVVHLCWLVWDFLGTRAIPSRVVLRQGFDNLFVLLVTVVWLHHILQSYFLIFYKFIIPDQFQSQYFHQLYHRVSNITFFGPSAFACSSFFTRKYSSSLFVLTLLFLMLSQQSLQFGFFVSAAYEIPRALSMIFPNGITPLVAGQISQRSNKSNNNHIEQPVLKSKNVTFLNPNTLKGWKHYVLRLFVSNVYCSIHKNYYFEDGSITNIKIGQRSCTHTSLSFASAYCLTNSLQFFELNSICFVYSVPKQTTR